MSVIRPGCVCRGLTRHGLVRRGLVHRTFACWRRYSCSLALTAGGALTRAKASWSTEFGIQE
ncbi:MAG: hypothetical protein R3E97_21960 [Candidatus Eisenbacteria bacterium]